VSIVVFHSREIIQRRWCGQKVWRGLAAFERDFSSTIRVTKKGTWKSNFFSKATSLPINTMASFNPTQIFDDGTTEEKGENARLSAFVGAIAVGDLGILHQHNFRDQQLI
jgi:hypothetical protein